MQELKEVSAKTATVLEKGVLCPYCGGRNYPLHGGMDKCLFCGQIFQLPTYYRAERSE